MPSFLQPDPVLLFFFSVKQVLFLELVTLLALVRVIVARQQARWIALLALLLGLAGIAAKFLPPILGLASGPLVSLSAIVKFWGTGVAYPLAVSSALLLSGVLRGRRWWGIDAIHILLLAGFLGLWIYSLVG